MGNNLTEDNCTIDNQGLYTFYSSVMILEFLLALPLNLSVLYIFIFRFKFWKTNTIFLFNLVLADILLLACLPVKVYYYQHGYRCSVNETTCKAMLFMLFLNRGASIAFLTAVSVDRYLNVVHPHKKNYLKLARRKPHISVFIWVSLLPLTIPTMLRTFECCNIIDHVKIIQKLSQRSIGKKVKIRRAVFLVILVVVVFGVCFLPCTTSRLVLLVVRIKNLHYIEKIAAQVNDGITCLSYIDCLLDPIVYCFCSSNFKTVYMSNFCPCLLKKETNTQDTSTRTRFTKTNEHTVAFWVTGK
nr:PREDICTED: 12-(S)-hydroxy-5,8,10,14-eicosatetraenoic acid receptor [Lepisosteus oculatus]